MHGLPSYLKTPALILALIAAFLIGSIGSVAFLSATQAGKHTPPVPIYDKTDKPLPPIDSAKSYGILLIGFGGEGHSGGYLSDVLMLLHINPDTRVVNLISIPRDLWVPVPVGKDKTVAYKINAGYAIGRDDRNYPLKELRFQGKLGGGELSKHLVSSVTGLPVDSFVAVDFEGFKSAINVLGGIDVEVPVAFDDNYYPIKGLENEPCGYSAEEIANITGQFSGFALEKQFSCRYEHLHFDKGITHMDGETALKFVRSRHSEQHGGDFARSARQQALLTALNSKLLSLGALNKIDIFFQQFAGSLTTDITPALIKELITKLGNPDDYTVKKLGLSEENVLKSATSSSGQFILIPKSGEGGWGVVQDYLKNNL